MHPTCRSQKRRIPRLAGDIGGAAWRSYGTRKIIAGVNGVDNSVIGISVAAATTSMSFNVKARPDEEFVVLELSGTLTLSPALNTLRDVARKALASSKVSGLILHVAGVTQFDSAGLGELTIVYTVASQRSCPLRLVGATPGFRKMLEMTRLEDLFHPVETLVIAKRQLRT